MTSSDFTAAHIPQFRTQVSASIKLRHMTLNQHSFIPILEEFVNAVTLKLKRFLQLRSREFVQSCSPYCSLPIHAIQKSPPNPTCHGSPSVRPRSTVKECELGDRWLPVRFACHLSSTKCGIGKSQLHSSLDGTQATLSTSLSQSRASHRDSGTQHYDRCCQPLVLPRAKLPVPHRGLERVARQDEARV